MVYVCSSGDPNGVYKTKEWLERVIVVGMNVSPATITISSGADNTVCLIINMSIINMSLPR